MAQSCDYGAVVMFNLPICLQVVACRDDLLYLMEWTKWCKTLAHKLGSVVGQ